MRLELALIVGILFFCCWCAYIIVKMNSSVVGSSNEHEHHQYHHQQLQPSQLRSNQTYSSQYHSQTPTSYNGQRAGDYQQVSSVPYYYSAATSQPSQQLSQVRYPDANHQTRWLPSQQNYVAAAAQASKWPANTDYRYQQPVDATHYVAAPSDQLAQQLAEAANFNSEPSEEDPSEDATEDAGSPTDSGQAAPEDEPQAEASDGTQADQEEQPAEEEEEEEPQQPVEDDLGLDVPINSELVERAGKRSFDESDSEVQERDKDGVLIKEHRKHLVNGKPVRNRRADKRASKQLAKAVEFDKIVDEIDNIDEATAKGSDQEETTTAEPKSDKRVDEAEAKLAKVADKISEASSIAKVTRARPLKPGKPGVSKPKDSHRHQLYETLSAQKWDNDDDNGIENTTESTTEAPQTIFDFDDLDLFSGGEPKSTGKRRRKRQVANGTDTIVVSLAGSHNGTAFPAMQATYRYDNATLARFNDTRGDQVKRSSNHADPVSSEEDMSIEVMSGAPVRPGEVYTNVGATPPPVAHMPPPLSMPPPLPPPPPPPANYNQQSGLVLEDQRVNHGGYSPSTNAQGFVDVQPGSYGALGPYAPTNPLASGSKKVKKKKKKKKSSKKSKLYESKYDAAKAHAMKKRKKFKKGSMQAKKHKAKKKLVNNYKVFDGATKGKKGAKGKAHRGAKKGTLSYKDKGYKKRGFKKAYQKVEAGDHKTYFDEYRDKDHKKKWKNFKDGHHYSQHKHWAGKDKKLHKDYKLGSMKHKNSKSGAWKEKKASKYKKDYKHKSSIGKKTAKKSSSKKKAKEGHKM